MTYFVVFLVPVFGIIFISLLGSAIGVTNHYQGFSNGVLTGSGYIKVSKVLFWVLYANFLGVCSYLILSFINVSEASIGAYSAVLFWIFLALWIRVFGRLSLVNIKLYVAMALLSIGLAFWLKNTIFELEPSELVPETSDVIFQFWLLATAFFVAVIIDISESGFDYEPKKRKFWIRSALRIQDKGFVPKKYTGNLRALILAILVKEDFERPKVFRIFERPFGKTTGIGQMPGRGHSDSKSAMLACDKISDLYQNASLEVEETDYKELSIAQKVAFDFNHSYEYSYEISDIYQVLKTNAPLFTLEETQDE